MFFWDSSFYFFDICCWSSCRNVSAGLNTILSMRLLLTFYNFKLQELSKSPILLWNLVLFFYNENLFDHKITFFAVFYDLTITKYGEIEPKDLFGRHYIILGSLYLPFITSTKLPRVWSTIMGYDRNLASGYISKSVFNLVIMLNYIN
jgi:hypothetical protein